MFVFIVFVVIFVGGGKNGSGILGRHEHLDRLASDLSNVAVELVLCVSLLSWFGCWLRPGEAFFSFTCFSRQLSLLADAGDETMVLVRAADDENLNACTFDEVLVKSRARYSLCFR
jgi:hypothetical protein